MSTRISSGAARTSSSASPEQQDTSAPSSGTARSLLSIGELARRAQVSPRTIRYYEELGILPTPQRTAGGSRRYPPEYLSYVQGALLLKELGFSLEEVRELCQGTQERTGEASARTHAMLATKMAVLEQRIRLLSRLHDLIRAAAEGGGEANSGAAELLRLLGEEAQAAGSASSPTGQR